jgi:hypothetical protein
MIQRQSVHDDASSADFLRRFGATVLCALLGIMTANYVVNPLDLYSTRLFEPMVRSSRVTKMRAIDALGAAKPEAIVLGSSRAMQISPSLITGGTGLRAFNFATDSARAEDYYADLRWLIEDAGLSPKLVIVGVDVEAFHNQAAPDERLLAIPALSRYLDRGERMRAMGDRFRRLVSRQQTQLTALSLARTAWRAGLRATGRRRGGDPVHSHFEADGYLRYDDWERERAEGRFNLDANIQSSVTEYVGRFTAFTALSDAREAYFHALLAYAADRHIRVVIYVTPLHPSVIEALEPLGYSGRLREATTFLAAEAQTAGAAFVDFSTIDRFGGAPRAFWDGGHVDDVNSDLITRRLLGAVRALQ